MNGRVDKIWQNKNLSKSYLEDVRGALPYASDQLEIMLYLLAANQRPVNHFADLGCGDGALSQAILSRYPQARGVLVDFAGPMLSAARSKLRIYNKNLQFLNRDLAQPKWLEGIREGGSFDVIVSGLAIHHQSHQRKKELYQEIFDLLNPGGFFLHLERVAPASEWTGKVFEDFFIDALCEFNSKKSGGKTREQLTAEYKSRAGKEAYLLAPVEDQCRWLAECGFVDVDCYFKFFQLALFGGRRP